MIMIIAIIYVFLSYVMFHQQLTITFRNFSALPPFLKIHSPLFTPPLNIQKVQVLTFFANIENFPGPRCRKEGWRTLSMLLKHPCKQCNSS